jgi:hypothetical protein
MRTPLLLLGTAFVLLNAVPVRANQPVPDHAAYRQFPTDLQRWHPSAMPAVSGLNIHAGMLPPTAQDQTPAARRLSPQPWWADELARRR